MVSNGQEHPTDIYEYFISFGARIIRVITKGVRALWLVGQPMKQCNSPVNQIEYLINQGKGLVNQLNSMVLS